MRNLSSTQPLNKNCSWAQRIPSKGETEEVAGVTYSGIICPHFSHKQLTNKSLQWPMLDTQSAIELHKLFLLLDLLRDFGSKAIGMGLQSPKSKFNLVWHILH